jgi:hypothetical protein
MHPTLMSALAQERLGERRRESERRLLAERDRGPAAARWPANTLMRLAGQLLARPRASRTHSRHQAGIPTAER